MAPEGADFVLPANVPDVEFDVFVGYCFDVEADGGDRGDVLVEFELVEDCWGGDCQWTCSLGGTAWLSSLRSRGWVECRCVDLLVFPAASRPSMSRRISFDPKILPIILEICPPIFAV